LLDPDQSSSFRDLYLNFPFDLSELLIIGTANDVETMHPALRDRFEIIELPPYTDDEELVILSRYVLPQLMESHILTEDHITISEDTLEALVARSSESPGVRQLERDCRRILRRAAFLLQQGESHVTIEPETVVEWLGDAPRRKVVGFGPRGDR
jgi:ATP-dependent Lon protease